MYGYIITATLANASARLDLTTKESVLQECADRFSQKSENAANPKSLKVLQITPEIALLELSSTLPLDHPGKALRLFSTLVLEADPAFRDAVTASGRLLRTTELPSSPVSPSAPCPEDRAFLHAMVDAVWSGDPRLAELKAKARELGLLN